jgi:hypothetical protein
MPADKLWRFECACGADHTPTVDRVGYPNWHAAHRFVEDCAAGDREHRCCHVCAVTCDICGCHYCPQHQKGFGLGSLYLCEDCSAHYTEFAPARDRKDVDTLIGIESKIAAGRPYGHGGDPSRCQVDWLIQKLKEAWEALASAPRA